ncbi:MAG: hypothetical protein R2862_10660 [Thermoanaerobaculia bacterium]
MLTPLRTAAVATLLTLSLAACPGPPRGESGPPVAAGDLFSPYPDGNTPPSDGGSIRRTFECTQRAPDGSCLQNKCTQGPGGATFDCASFATACVEAGEHWSGTKEGGVCTKVL